MADRTPAQSKSKEAPSTSLDVAIEANEQTIASLLSFVVHAAQVKDRSHRTELLRQLVNLSEVGDTLDAMRTAGTAKLAPVVALVKGEGDNQEAQAAWRGWLIEGQTPEVTTRKATMLDRLLEVPGKLWKMEGITEGVEGERRSNAVLFKRMIGNLSQDPGVQTVRYDGNNDGRRYWFDDGNFPTIQACYAADLGAEGTVASRRDFILMAQPSPEQLPASVDD